MTDDELRAMCEIVISESPDEAALYWSGKTAIGVLIGKVMMQVKGNENPRRVFEMFHNLLMTKKDNND